MVENAIRDLKYGVGLNRLPSGRFGANAAWLALNVMAHNMSRPTVRIGGLDIVAASTATPHPADGSAPSGQAASTKDTPAAPGATNRKPPRRRRRGERVDFVATDTLRRSYLAVPGRLATSARTLTLHLPARWPWAEQFRHAQRHPRRQSSHLTTRLDRRPWRPRRRQPKTHPNP